MMVFHHDVDAWEGDWIDVQLKNGTSFKCVQEFSKTIIVDNDEMMKLICKLNDN